VTEITSQGRGEEGDNDSVGDGEVFERIIHPKYSPKSTKSPTP